MNGTELISRHQQGSLEVEDLLALASEPAEEALIELRNYLATTEPIDQVTGRWVDTILTFLQGGYAELVKVTGTITRPFVYGLLEHLRTSEAMRLISADIVNNPDQCRKRFVPDTINSIMSFGGAPSVEEETLEPIRTFLHKELKETTDEATLAGIMYALRGIGNMSTLIELKRHQNLRPPYQNALKLARSAIKRRV